MVYLALLSGIKKNKMGNYNPILTLKAGFTEDNEGTSRFEAYESHIYGAEMLYKIEDATEYDEIMFHRKFAKYRIHRKEFYKYTKNIIGFFRNHPTKESFRKALGYYLPKSLTNAKYQELLILLNPYAYSIIQVTEKISDNDFINYFESVSNIVSDIIQEYKVTLTEDDAIEYIERFYPDDYTEILSLVPHWKSVDWTFTEDDKCVDEITVETCIKASKEDLKSRIYSEFLVGNKYTKKEIKKKMGEIYKETNTFQTPKASDIGKYFDIKRVMTTNPITKKRDNGFKIISKKD